MAAGAIGLAASVVPVRRSRVGRREHTLFRVVNDLPDWLHRPAWAVMQLGALGATPVATAAAYGFGERRLAIRLAAGGGSAWVLAKVVKQVVRRDRPGALLADVSCRGPEAGGRGYVSGHAAVAVALALAASPRLGRWGRPSVLGVAALVGLSRIYVGAHLPLDVVGGASLGLLVDGATRWQGCAR